MQLPCKVNEGCSLTIFSTVRGPWLQKNLRIGVLFLCSLIESIQSRANRRDFERLFGILGYFTCGSHACRLQHIHNRTVLRAKLPSAASDSEKMTLWIRLSPSFPFYLGQVKLLYLWPAHFLQFVQSFTCPTVFLQ